MPFTNTTHTSSSQADSHSAGPSGSVTSTGHVTSNPVVGQTYAGELYYGIGRFLRNQWDYLYQTFWKDSLASSEAIARKQRDIYLAGLKECIEQLKPAIENVRKNPHDPASLGKVDDLAQHYAAYVNLHPTLEWHLYQQELFQPLREQVERFADLKLKRKLNMLLPVLAISASEKVNQKSDASVVKEEYSIGLSQSYYETKSYVKRAIHQQAFPAVFDLNSLDGTNGFTVPGVASIGQLGVSVSMAGDINGDAIMDLVLGAYGANTDNGIAYVIFGSKKGFGSIFNLNNLDGNNGFIIPGVETLGTLGYSVSTAGDINADNISDLVLGAYGVSSNNGAAYVIFGSRGGFGSIFNLTTLNGTNGFSVQGIVSGGLLGYSVSTAGDINGDNITDLVLGASSANGNGNVYVIFGSRGGFGSIFNLTTLNGTNGFRVQGIVSGGQLGISVNTAGDINGDDLTDLVLGANGPSSGNGNVYVIFGSRAGFGSIFNLITLNGTNGFMVPGIMLGGDLGFSVSATGDINGDNITDLVLGALGQVSSNSATYIIFGSRAGFGSIFNLTNLNGTNGFTIPGIASGTYLGVSVSMGDINRDNLADIILGASGTSSNNGAAYVIFGSRAGFGSIFNLTNLNGANGFTIPGIESGAYLGRSVSTIGDINGDNITDMGLGAFAANSGNGTAYVIFGQNTVVSPSPAPTPTPTPTPTAPSLPLIPCQITEPLAITHNDIQINKGQNLRLTPNDLSAKCGNNTLPNLGTAFTVTGITHAQVQTRNNSGFWNNASSFLGTDLSQGNVALVQDNSTFAPEFNISITDGQTTLNSAVNIEFSTNQSTPQITGIGFAINATGTTLLNASQFQITDTESKLDNVVISISASQGGYFSITNDPTQPITDFTYYQLQDGQIQFVHNTTALPNVTLTIGDGSGQSVQVRPLISFFDTNNSNTPSVPIGAVVGSTVGALAAIGLGVFGIFKYRQHQQQEEHTVQSAANQRLR